jgi:tetratricopeptide (TPR) repeat protein
MAAVVLILASTPLAGAKDVAGKTAGDKQAVAVAEELKGDLARVRKDYEEAVADYQTALRNDPHNAMLYNKMGVTRLQLRDHGGARRSFRRAIDLDPQNASFLNNLGALYYLDKKYDQAVRYLKQSLALDEMNASCHLNIAEAWMSMGQADRAMTEYARALELDADILSTSQDGVVAQVRTPEQRARISFMIAKAYAKRGNVEGALEYLKRAKEDRFPELHRVYADQEFAPLWSDPRLEKIVKK